MITFSALLRLLLAVILALLGWLPLRAAVPPPAFLDTIPAFVVFADVVSAVSGSLAVGGGDEVVDDVAVDTTDEVVDDVASGDQVAEDAAAEATVDGSTGDQVVDDSFGDEVVDDSFGDEAVGDVAVEDPVDTVDQGTGDTVTGDAATSDPNAGTDEVVDPVDATVDDTGDVSGGGGADPTVAPSTDDGQSDVSPTADAGDGTDSGVDSAPTETPSETPVAEEPLPPTPLVGFRLNDPILQWLPELNQASEQTGVPVELLAALMRTTSAGEPGLQTTDGRFGLLFVRQRAFVERRIADNLRNDPQVNILTGADAIARIGTRGGTFDAALIRYFGSFCDASGDCTRDYVRAIDSWTEYYAALFADTALGGLAPLPDGYIPALFDTFVVETLDGLEFPATGDPVTTSSTADDGTVSAETPVVEDAAASQAVDDPVAADTPVAEPAPTEPVDRPTRRDRRATETPVAGG